MKIIVCQLLIKEIIYLMMNSLKKDLIQFILFKFMKMDVIVVSLYVLVVHMMDLYVIFSSDTTLYLTNNIPNFLKE